MQRATAARHRTGQVRHELVPRLFRRPERAEDAARDHCGATLLDATHRQTQVLRLDHDADALGVQSILQEVGDLLRHALPDLQTPGEHFDDTWDLRKPDYAASGQVTHRSRAEERQHVVIVRA
jgi:hypothetical protein